jgi:Holliday junction resolvase RusA-like endonuclease
MKLIPSDAIVYLEVTGRPAPQGSKKGFARGGKVAMVEMSKYVKPWRQDVRSAAEAWVARSPDLYPLPGALSVDMVFSIARPKGHYGTGRNAGVLKPNAPAHPASMPDLSKLARSTEDALTSAGVWSDDARVVEYGRLAKRYVVDDIGLFDVYARTTPGAVILVRQMEVAW